MSEIAQFPYFTDDVNEIKREVLLSVLCSNFSFLVLIVH